MVEDYVPVEVGLGGWSKRWCASWRWYVIEARRGGGSFEAFGGECGCLAEYGCGWFSRTGLVCLFAGNGP